MNGWANTAVPQEVIQATFSSELPPPEISPAPASYEGTKEYEEKMEWLDEVPLPDEPPEITEKSYRYESGGSLWEEILPMDEEAKNKLFKPFALGEYGTSDENLRYYSIGVQGGKFILCDCLDIASQNEEEISEEMAKQLTFFMNMELTDFAKENYSEFANDYQSKSFEEMVAKYGTPDRLAMDNKGNMVVANKEIPFSEMNAEYVPEEDKVKFTPKATMPNISLKAMVNELFNRIPTLEVQLPFAETDIRWEELSSDICFSLSEASENTPMSFNLEYGDEATEVPLTLKEYEDVTVTVQRLLADYEATVSKQNALLASYIDVEKSLYQNDKSDKQAEYLMNNPLPLDDAYVVNEEVTDKEYYSLKGSRNLENELFNRLSMTIGEENASKLETAYRNTKDENDFCVSLRMDENGFPAELSFISFEKDNECKHEIIITQTEAHKLKALVDAHETTIKENPAVENALAVEENDKKQIDREL